MKNTKKLLILALALIALTLAMSISIFAEESTEPRVFWVDTTSELVNALDCGQTNNKTPKAPDGTVIQDGDIIRLSDNIGTEEVPLTGAIYVKKNIVLDLNGKTLTTSGPRSVIMFMNGSVTSSAEAKGTWAYFGSNNALRVYGNVSLIENINIVCTARATSATDKASGISVLYSGSNGFGTGHVELIRNVEISGPDLKAGIEGATTIAAIEGVTVENASQYGLWIKGACGTVSESTIKGNIGVYFENNGSVAFVDTTIAGNEAGIKIAEGKTVSLTVDDKTAAKLTATNGPVVNTAGEGANVSSSITIPGYTFANGVVECEEHSYVAGEEVAPTCTAGGYTEYNCSGCGATKKEAGEAALGHSYSSVVTAPTCEAEGYTTYTCSVCNDTYQDNKVAALGHAYSETSRVEATEEADGYIEYTCSVCQGTKREVLLYCAHNFVVLEEVEVSCLVDGYVKSECSLCGEIKEVTTPKEAHTYDWDIVGCPKCGTRATLDEGSTNVSSNLGYTIYFATTLNDLSNTNYDVIRLKNNISLPSGGTITNPNAIIDLGGNVLYRNGGWLGLRIVAAKGFVNGYVYKTNGGSQIMAVTSLEFMEDVTLCANSTLSNNATGLLMNTAGAYLGSMKNVTICAGVLNDLNSNNFDFVNVGTNGIYNHGIEATQGTIGSMENVKISTYGQAITTAAKIGTMTNCVFSGDGMALNITKLHSEMKFVNCEIHSKNIAIYIADADDSTEEAPVSFELENTKIVTDGAVYALTDHIKDKEIFADLTSAVALVNGKLYTSLEDAVNALKASKEEVTTFALIGDLEVDETIVIDKKVNFSFGGATYNVPVYGTNQVVSKTTQGYTVTSSVEVAFKVVEGGDLTVSGDGKLIGTENAIVADGGEILIAAGTYVGYNPQSYVSTNSCVVNTNGTYAIASEHDYDDEVGADKVTYQVDGVCNNCGFVRGNYAVDNVYFMTLEEALAAALANGKQIVLANDIVIDSDVVWDFTGATFNFNGLTVTVNGSLAITGGTFTQDVSQYVAAAEYCHYKNNNNLYVVAPHVWVDATCTTAKTCSVCGATEGEALGHSYDAVVTAPTCEDGGYTTYTCSVCGDTYTADETEATGHSFNEWSYNAETGALESACANGCGATETKAVVATANGEYYETLQAAINAGGTVVVINDIVVDATIVVNGEVTLDLNGYTVSMADASEATAALIKNNGTLTITDGSEAKTGKLSFATTTPSMSNAYASNTISNYGTLVVNGGTIENVSATGSACYAIDGYANSATTINGGIITANKTTVRVFNWTTGSTSTLTVNGGYIYSADAYGINFNMGNAPTVEFAVTGGKIETEDTDYALAVYVVSKGSAENVTINVTGGEFLGNFALNGVTSTTMADDKVSISGGTYTGTVICYADPAYGFVTGGTFEGEVSADYMADGYAQINGTVAFCTHENLLADETLPTCTDKGYTTYTCEDCGYTYVDDETEALGHSYVESGRTETEITYTCSVCGDSYSEEYVPEHTHTEEVIPMVLPTPSVDGYTAGIKCSECDEIIVAPELITVTDLASNAELRYRGASLTPKENISVNYQLQVPAGYTNVYTVFVFLGEEYVVTDYKIDASTGRYVYKFLYAFPQLMQENITAYAYAINENGEWVRNVRDGYSIQAYCESQLDSTDAELLTVISDILVLGAETQKYMGYKTDSLVTDLVKAKGFTLTPTKFTTIDPSENVQALVGTKNEITDWTGGSLVLGASTKMKLTFKTDTIENVQIKIVIDGVETIYDAEDIVPNKEAGKYDLEIDTITVLQFGSTVEGVILKDGVQVGRTMNYSINSYLYKNYNDSNVGALCKALYNYGVSMDIKF